MSSVTIVVYVLVNTREWIFLTRDTAWRDTAGTAQGPRKNFLGLKIRFFSHQGVLVSKFFDFCLANNSRRGIRAILARHRQEFAPFCKEFAHCGEMRPSGGNFLTFSR